MICKFPKSWLESIKKFGKFTRIIIYLVSTSCHPFFQVFKIVKHFSRCNCLTNKSSSISNEVTSLHKFLSSLLLWCNFKFPSFRWPVGLIGYRPRMPSYSAIHYFQTLTLCRQLANFCKNSKILEPRLYVWSNLFIPRVLYRFSRTIQEP